ncbi:HAD family hydrolase [Microbispora catharanthi]|uniref:HAD-IA family hydrolase n=1 Tax=Microbispora catharanthi TaxID=1712871 RepID=A0A5N6C4G5_9ACTN|nr:HAD-IA family hydrolase [Microbispora catharanthi]KAB8187705.1 HAD-IA family hydrolase [Microbispora catharanthi]
MATRAFDAVLCDFDGVLKFQDLEQQAEIERTYGVEPGTVARVTGESALVAPALTGLVTREEWLASAVPVLAGLVGSAARASALTADWLAARTWADEEVLALLTRARARVPVVLVSNATSELASHLRELELHDAFDHVVSSYDVGVAKPDPRIFEIAARHAGVPPGRCLFVDDRAENVGAARVLGMTGVVFRAPADLETALFPLFEEAS